MAKTTFVQITDDIDGGVADETVSFSYRGTSYEIDLNKKNAAAFDKAIEKYLGKARRAGRGSGRRAAAGGSATLFSQLDSEEKDRFRAWAKLPNARRIADAKVKEWTEAGRP